MKPKLGEDLQLYLVISNKVISAVIIKKEKTAQLPLYYTNKAFLAPKVDIPISKS